MGNSPQFWLAVLGGEKRGSRVSIDKPITVGSSRDSDVHLRDAAVSWRHARFESQGDGVIVEDLGSANGTLVNGTRVDRSRLREGDRILIGGTELALVRTGAEAPRSREVASLEETAQALAERQRALETEIESLRRELASSQSRAEGLAGERDLALASAAERGRALEASQIQLAERERRSRHERVDRGRRLREVEDLGAAQERTQRELDAARADLGAAKERAASQTAALDEAARTLAALEAERQAVLGRSSAAQALLERQVEDLRRSLAEREHAVAELRERSEAAAAEFAQLRQRLFEEERRDGVRRDALLDLERRVAAREGELEGTRASLARLEADRARLAGDAERVEAAGRAARDEDERRRREDHAAWDEERRRLRGELERQSAALQSRIEELASRARSEIAALEAKESVLAGEKADLAARLRAREAEMALAESGRRGLEERLTQLAARETELETSLAQAAEAFREREASRAEVVERLGAADVDLERLRETTGELTAEVGELRQRADESRQLLELAERTRRADLEHIEDLKATAAKLETELAMGRDYVEEARRRINEKEAEVRDLRWRAREELQPRDESQVLEVRLDRDSRDEGAEPQRPDGARAAGGPDLVVGAPGAPGAADGLRERGGGERLKPLRDRRRKLA